MRGLKAAFAGVLLAGFTGTAALAAPADDYQAAGAAYTANNYSRAVQLYSAYIAAMPNDANGYYGRADSLYALDKYAEALPDYRKGLSIKPSYDGFVALGNTLDMLKRYDEAMGAYDGAITLDSSKVSAFKEKGVAQYNNQDYGAAAKSYARAAAIAPTDEAVQRFYGKSLLYDNQHAAAIAPLVAADKLKPNQTDTLTVLGDAYHGARRDPEALAAYDKALAVNPAYYAALLGKGNVFYNRDDYAGSVPLYQAAARADAKNPRPLSYLADAYYYLGRYPESKAQFLAAINLESGFVDAHEGLARTLNKMNDKPGALAEIEAVRKIDQTRADKLSKELYPQ